MIPKYLFLVFLMLVLLAGCSSNEPLPTLDWATESPPSVSGPEVVPTGPPTEVPVDVVVSTEVPVKPVVEVVASAETVLPATVENVVPTAALEAPSPTVPTSSPEVTEVPMLVELSSADAVLGALIAASEAVETGSYEINVVSDISGEGLGVPMSVKMLVDYQKPDRQQVTAQVGFSFMNIQIEMVVVGEMVYMKDPISGKWYVDNDGELATEGFHELLSIVQPSDLLGRLTLAGDSLIDGRSVLHLEGDVPLEVLGEVGEGIESLWLRYSVGSQDYLMYGSEIRMTDDEGTVTTVTFRFFDYGKELDIRAPEIDLVRPPSGFDGSDCDATLRQQLVFQRGASRAVHMNEIVAQLQATRSECPAGFWNPEAENSVTSGAVLTGWTGVADECWGFCRNSGR